MIKNTDTEYIININNEELWEKISKTTHSEVIYKTTSKSHNLPDIKLKRENICVISPISTSRTLLLEAKDKENKRLKQKNRELIMEIEKMKNEKSADKTYPTIITISESSNKEKDQKENKKVKYDD